VFFFLNSENIYLYSDKLAIFPLEILRNEYFTVFI